MHPSTCSLLLEIFHFSFVSPLSSNNFSLLRSFTFLFSFPGVCVWGGIVVVVKTHRKIMKYIRGYKNKQGE